MLARVEERHSATPPLPLAVAPTSSRALMLPTIQAAFSRNGRPLGPEGACYSHHRLGRAAQVRHEDLQLVGRLAEVRDDGDGRLDDLARLALLVDLAQAAPLANRLAGGDLDQRHALLRAERADKLGVRGLVAVLREAAQARAAGRDGELAIGAALRLGERLDALVQAAAEAVGDEGLSHARCGERVVRCRLALRRRKRFDALTMRRTRRSASMWSIGSGAAGAATAGASAATSTSGATAASSAILLESSDALEKNCSGTKGGE